MANSWYIYLGQDRDPLVPSSYRRLTVTPPCLNGVVICAIDLLNETTTTPPNALTANMLVYISNALCTLTPQPIDIGAKHYVYLKGA